MGNNERARQAQFELMISYMERHGDIQYLSERIESHKRWNELAKLLNNKTIGEPKPVSKWRKCWSDFKNNTKRKELRIKRNHCRVDLTRLEKRLLKLIEIQKASKKKTIESENQNIIIVKTETVQNEDPCQVTPQYNISDAQSELPGRRKSSSSSSNSVNSNEETPTPRRRKRRRSFEDKIKDVAEKYLDFEREREKMAHDREMARIKQNDQLIMIFGKIVNVLETLTPNIQNYLDRGNNDNIDEKPF